LGAGLGVISPGAFSFAMAPSRVRFADEAASQLVGLKVKNTFIDDIDELGADAGAAPQEQPGVRRSTTAPLLRHKILELDVDDGSESTVSGEQPPTDSDEEGPQPMMWPKTMSGDDLEAMLGWLEAEEAEEAEASVEAPVWPRTPLSRFGDASPWQTPVWPRTMSGDDLAAALGLEEPWAAARCGRFMMEPAGSAAVRRPCEPPVVLCLEQCSPGASSCSTASPASAASPVPPSPATGGQESKLAALVTQECGFEKLTSCTLMQLMPRSSKSKRASPGGVSRCLRVCVAGLPQLKRHKWQQPLLLSVAGVLDGKGCPAMIRRGELFASLDGTESGEMVRVDLCAPRDTDKEA